MILYRDYIIDYIDYMNCYRIYHKDYPNNTVAYSDDSIENIKKSIDKQCYYEV